MRAKQPLRPQSNRSSAEVWLSGGVRRGGDSPQTIDRIGRNRRENIFRKSVIVIRPKFILPVQCEGVLLFQAFGLTEGRNAAWPIEIWRSRPTLCFFFTTSLSSIVPFVLPAQAYNGVRFYRPVSGATLGIGKAKQVLQDFCIRRVPEIGASALTFTKSSFLNFSRWCESVEARMPNSKPMSLKIFPSGCADDSRRMIRKRGPVPIAKNISVKRVISSSVAAQ